MVTKGWWIGPYKESLDAKPKLWSEDELVLLTRAGYPSFQHFILDPLVNVVAHQHIIPHARPMFRPLISDEAKVFELAGGNTSRVFNVPDAQAGCSKKGVWFNIFCALSPPRDPKDPYHRLPFQHAMIVSHFEQTFRKTRTAPPKRRVLYLQRGHGTRGYRDVANEDKVLEVLRQFLQEHAPHLELIPYKASAFSFPQTVDLMHSADLIIGVHGGAIANAVFATPNTTIIEFCRAAPGDPPWTSYFSNGLESRPFHVCVQRRLMQCGSSRTTYVDLDELRASLNLWRTKQMPNICFKTKDWLLVEDPIVKRLRAGKKK